MSTTELLRRQYDEMVSENARLTAALAVAEARAAAAEQRADAAVAALEKEQAVEDHTLECLYCLHNDEDDCTEIAGLRADAGVARAAILAAQQGAEGDA